MYVYVYIFDHWRQTSLCGDKRKTEDKVYWKNLWLSPWLTIIDSLRWGWGLEQMRILSKIQLRRHFIEFGVVETKQFVSSDSKWDLDAANLRPALKHGCAKQTPSASICFSRTNLVCVLNFKNLEKSSISTSRPSRRTLLRTADFRRILRLNTF